MANLRRTMPPADGITVRRKSRALFQQHRSQAEVTALIFEVCFTPSTSDIRLTGRDFRLGPDSDMAFGKPLCGRNTGDRLPACLLASRFLLAGIFESLRNLPANGQLDVAVDADINNHWTIFNRESFVDLAEIVGPIDSEALGA